MDIWLARHGLNDMGGEEYLDRERGLIPRGVKQVAAVAASMKKAGECPSAILSSVFRRTMETADIFGRAFNTRVVPCDELCPEIPLYHFLVKLLQENYCGLMLVGHHLSFECLLNKCGDGKAPALMAMGEVRRYSLEDDDDDNDFDRMCLRYRVTPYELGVPDMLTLRSVLGVK